ncbi:acetyl-CoA carboxylase biotin carboxyl carrier protein subunit [Erwinia sp. CPCC 100877]|nr:acetyl-CoA carboxylase biotin carboxyl carrier protein subunit [Erwinia sp. CPCC 100877]
MLRKFKISIDGKEYLVEMEEIGGVPQPSAPTQPIAAPEPVPTVAAAEEAESAPATPSGSVGADALTAPMPGTILSVLVNVGDTVTENQPVMILEAMKMENEVVAPKAGTVTGIHVAQGQIVNPGEALITIA